MTSFTGSSGKRSRPVLTAIDSDSSSSKRPRRQGHCQICQMPLDLLCKWESAEVHASHCLETDFSELPKCPEGITCDCTIRNHYCRFNHFELAAAYANTTLYTKSLEDDLQVDTDEDVEQVAEESKPMQEKFDLNDSFDSIIDQMVEESVKSPLKVEATKDTFGGLQIQVSVDPDANVELETLVMKIPKDSAVGQKVDILSRVHARKQQQTTLDSYFGQGTSTKTFVPDQLNKRAKNKGFIVPKSGLKRDDDDNKRRQCPFYKKIPDTKFVVDAFSYGYIDGVTTYFLSHFHYDHYNGLHKHWKEPIVCSPITARLLRLKIKVDQQKLRVVTLNQPTVMDNVQVTLLDANHCPGSVMFLFKCLKSGKELLHCGDFRACPEMEEYPELWNCHLSRVYLDTTYCRPQYDFPSQSDVVSRTVELVSRHVKTHPLALVCVGSYTIGKERIFVAIAEALKSNVWAATTKSHVLRTLNDDFIDRNLVSTAFLAGVHVVDMSTASKKSELDQHWKKYADKFDNILGIVPTGWTHTKEQQEGSSSSSSLAKVTVRNLGGHVFQLKVPYSEHSSYSELKRFVQFLKLSSSDKIIATVNVGNPASRNAQKAIFQQWINEDRQVVF